MAMLNNQMVYTYVYTYIYTHTCSNRITWNFKHMPNLMKNMFDISIVYLLRMHVR
jgi:hypothetical protein